MKKFLAILLALVMVLAMVACGGGGEDTPPADDGAASGGEAAGGESSGVADTSTNMMGGQDEVVDNTATGEIGMYDPNYDYNANPKYKIAYYVLATGVLYEAMGDAIEHWCTMMNLEYGGMLDCGNDKDAYLSNLQTLATEYDGLLIDPDGEQFTRCAEILDEQGTHWMGVMGAARDFTKEGAPLMHPYVGFDQYQIGVICGDYLVKYYQKQYPDVDPSEIAWIGTDFSTFPLFHSRQQGFYDTVVAHDPTIADRYFTGDVAAIGLTTDAGSQVVAAVLSEHPEYEYWMCYGLIDDISMGAAIAFDVAGLTDTCATVTFGGTGLQLQWDAGIQDSWVAACYLPQTIYAEPIIGALYAFMSGQATPETIWPEWVPNNEIVPYAMRSLPAFWIEYENYQHMIRWSDIYAGSNFYSEYPDEVNGQPITRDDFSVSVPIPEGYAGYEG
ncbi:MAG: hypothetical protein IJO77_05450 [Oscillospiraceae bacterium]|nr:hypothetical protein [Oscillospiraceae bacterium]